jgi:hypothetical protein
MVDELPIHRVEARFVGTPPARQVERASGVSDVAVEGSTLRCLVCGSFQPFLEALRGHEVVGLTSVAAASSGTSQAPSAEAAYHPSVTTARGGAPRLDRREGDTMTDKAGSPAHADPSSGHGASTSATHTLTCPKCHGVMRTYARGGLILELCEDCRGIFLDAGELERLIEVEGGGWSGIVTAAVDPRR